VAKHPIRAFLNYTGTWTEVTTDVDQNDAVSVTQGGGEISSAPRPSRIELTFVDPNGIYRPDLPTSPLYGLAGRNTPLLLGDVLVTEGFESAGLAITVSPGASVNPWARSTTSPHSGTWCYQSGITADGAFSDAIIDAPAGATTCLLWYRTDSQATDVLRISTGGTLRKSVGGTGGTWTQIAVPIVVSSTGVRQVYCRYLKDASGSAGADAVYIDDVTFISGQMAEISSWEPDRTLGFNGAGRGKQWTAITAEGLLRRIGSWTDPLHSAMYRAIAGLTTLTNFWPGEDGRNASQMSSALGGEAAVVSDVTFNDDDSPGGGSTAMRLGPAGLVTGRFGASADPSNGQVAWACKLASVPASTSYLPLFTSTWSNGYTWTISVRDIAYKIEVFDSAGTLLDSLSSIFLLGNPDQWVTMRLQVSFAAGTVSWKLTWYVDQTAPVLATVTGSFAGTGGRPVQFTIASNTYTNDALFAYIYATSGATEDLLSSNIVNSFSGFPGELAGTRFLRLLREEGLGSELIGAATDTELMGPQRPDTLLALLQEIRDTDGGVLSDSAGQIGIALRTRQNVYRQTPALALTYGTNVAPPFKPVLDDLDTHNVVTVSQRDGGSATATDTTSSMSTLPPPLGVGTYKQTIDVNVLNESRLADLANWWLNIGTNSESRYAAVTIDLDADPSLEAAVTALKAGDRVTVAGATPDLIDLVVVGKVDTRNTQFRRTATLTCAPFRQYDVGVYDSTLKRYDSRTSTTSATLTATVGAIVVQFTDLRDAWSTVDCPYDWAVAGERIRVTAMGAVTGSGPWTQTATVTRSINGVVKTHAALEPIHMHPDQQARYAL
jgi:hypothetical protein